MARVEFNGLLERFHGCGKIEICGIKGIN